MFLMNKEANNGPRARVEILVGAPGSHIHTPTHREEEGVTVGGPMNECCSVYMVMKIFKYRGDFLLL